MLAWMTRLADKAAHMVALPWGPRLGAEGQDGDEALAATLRRLRAAYPDAPDVWLDLVARTLIAGDEDRDEPARESREPMQDDEPAAPDHTEATRPDRQTVPLRAESSPVSPEPGLDRARRGSLRLALRKIEAETEAGGEQGPGERRLRPPRLAVIAQLPRPDLPGPASPSCTPAQVIDEPAGSRPPEPVWSAPPPAGGRRQPAGAAPSFGAPVNKSAGLPKPAFTVQVETDDRRSGGTPIDRTCAGQGGKTRLAEQRDAALLLDPSPVRRPERRASGEMDAASQRRAKRAGADVPSLPPDRPARPPRPSVRPDETRPFAAPGERAHAFTAMFTAMGPPSARRAGTLAPACWPMLPSGPLPLPRAGWQDDANGAWPELPTDDGPPPQTLAPDAARMSRLARLQGEL